MQALVDFDCFKNLFFLNTNIKILIVKKLDAQTVWLQDTQNNSSISTLLRIIYITRYLPSKAIL